MAILSIIQKQIKSKKKEKIVFEDKGAHHYGIRLLKDYEY